MNKVDKQQVYEALKKYGDEFWRDVPDDDQQYAEPGQPGYVEGNWILFDDVLDACEKAGIKLAIRVDLNSDIMNQQMTDFVSAITDELNDEQKLALCIKADATPDLPGYRNIAKDALDIGEVIQARVYQYLWHLANKVMKGVPP